MLLLSKHLQDNVYYGLVLYSGFAILTFYLYQVSGSFLSEELEVVVGLRVTNKSLMYQLKEHVIIFFTYYFVLNYKNTDDKNLNEEKLKKNILKAKNNQGKNAFDIEKKKLLKNPDKNLNDQKAYIYNLDIKHIDWVTKTMIYHIDWAHYFITLCMVFWPP